MSDFLFNSNFNYQKVAKSGSTPASGDDISVTIASGLIANSDFRVFVEDGGVRRLWGTQASELAYMDGTNLKVYLPFGTGSVTFYWRVYVQS